MPACLCGSRWERGEGRSLKREGFGGRGQREGGLRAGEDGAYAHIPLLYIALGRDLHYPCPCMSCAALLCCHAATPTLLAYGLTGQVVGRLYS